MIASGPRSKVDRRGPDDCWEWTAGKTKYCYGAIRVDGKLKYTHRVSYEIHNGPIPEGLHVLHRCDNPICCNPEHIRVGTNVENMRDMVDRGRSAKGCKQGSSKLTEAEVTEIRKSYNIGNHTQIELADLFGVGQQHISRIVNRKLWRHS